MTCKECVHYEACKNILVKAFSKTTESEIEVVCSREGGCSKFKPKSRFVEVVRCEECKNWDKDTKIKAPYCTAEGKPIDMTMVDYAECEKWSCWSTAKYTRYNDFCSCGEKVLKEMESE